MSSPLRRHPFFLAVIGGEEWNSIRRNRSLFIDLQKKKQENFSPQGLPPEAQNRFFAVLTGIYTTGTTKKPDHSIKAVRFSVFGNAPAAVSPSGSTEGPHMSIRWIAQELYRLYQEVERIEKQLQDAPPEKAEALRQQLKRTRAERDRLRNALEGQKG